VGVVGISTLAFVRTLAERQSEFAERSPTESVGNLSLPTIIDFVQEARPPDRNVTAVDAPSCRLTCLVRDVVVALRPRIGLPYSFRLMKGE
jgi:hypothetical protein